MPKIIIDGKELETHVECTVIHACETAGLEIPRFGVIKKSIFLMACAFMLGAFTAPAVKNIEYRAGSMLGSTSITITSDRVFTYNYFYRPKTIHLQGTAHITEEEYNGLISTIADSGFWSLKNKYVNDQIADGDDIAVKINDKQVEVQNEPMPPSFQQIVNNIQLLQRKYIIGQIQ